MSSNHESNGIVGDEDRLSCVQERLGYHFRDAGLLCLALRHRSAAHEAGTTHNERLEFLGDAVVGLVCASWLYQGLPDEPEGELARRKSSLVSSEALTVIAKQLDLGSYLELGLGESRSGGRRKDSLLANALEAVVGAIFLDGGLEEARLFLESRLDGLLESHPELEVQDAKTRLQEILQARGGVATELPARG